MLKQYKLLQKQYETRYKLYCKQCRSRSAGFFRSQLIRIHTIFHTTCIWYLNIQHSIIKGLPWIYQSKTKSKMKTRLRVKKEVHFGPAWKYNLMCFDTNRQEVATIMNVHIFLFINKSHSQGKSYLMSLSRLFICAVLEHFKNIVGTL